MTKHSKILKQHSGASWNSIEHGRLVLDQQNDNAGTIAKTFTVNGFDNKNVNRLRTKSREKYHLAARAGLSHWLLEVWCQTQAVCSSAAFHATFELRVDGIGGR